MEKMVAEWRLTDRDGAEEEVVVVGEGSKSQGIKEIKVLYIYKRKRKKRSHSK